MLSLYMIMPHIDGGTLAQLLRTSAQIPHSARIGIIQQIAQALDYAHRCEIVDRYGTSQRGLLHGDLKPANIMLTQSRRPIVVDFLMPDLQRVKLAPEQYVRGASTAAYGTPGYMSPEQADRTGFMVPQSDIYSLGITLLQTLDPTFDPRTTSLRMRLVQLERGVRTGSIHARILSFIRRMVAINIKDRPQSMAHVVHELDAIRKAL